MDEVRVSIGQDARFELKRQLGEGGYGVVYEAYDTQENCMVALKTLRKLRPEALHEFKQEFRAVADVGHPNLVTLLELFADGGDCFLTMELIRGVPLLEHVWETPSNEGPETPVPTLTRPSSVPPELTRTQVFAVSSSWSQEVEGAAPTWSHSFAPAEKAMPFDAQASDAQAADAQASDAQATVTHALAPAISGALATVTHLPLSQGPRSPAASSPESTRSFTHTLTATLDLQAEVSQTHSFRDPWPSLRGSDVAGVSSRERRAVPRAEGRSPSSGISSFDETSEELPWRRLNVERLRAALLQVAEGLETIHQAGKLHRDIKCSNILVREDGRAVILDFGLAHALSPRVQVRSPSGEKVTGPLRSPSGAARHIVGTPAFMAPEVIRGEAVLASDWWAFGVVMYQCLTGRLPFRGTLLNMLHTIQEQEPTPPAELVRVLPEDLTTLCQELLQKDPTLRPTGAEIISRLQATSPTLETTLGSSRAPLSAELLVGRAAQLETLESAWEVVKAGRPLLVRVQGLSGMGKSMLLQHFLSSLAASDAPVILSGRCHERENLAFKALDPVVDGLAELLSTYEPTELARLIPPEWRALERLFPSVRHLLPLECEAEQTLDPHEQLRRAMQALRTLIGKLAAEHPLVIHLDDLQWGDADSAPLLSELLRQPQAPPVLVLCSYRSDELETSPFLQRLLEQLHSDPASPEEWVVEVDALSPEASERLVAHALAGREDWSPEQLRRLAAEGQGHPFLLSLLVERASRLHAHGLSREGLTLDQLILQLIAWLPKETQRLLEGVAVAGHPLALRVLKRALELEHVDSAGLAQAKLMRLVRVQAGVERLDVVEMYHDKLRTALYDALPAGRRRHLHEALGGVMASDVDGRLADTRPEWLADHFEAAGCRERALPYVLAAAEKGMQQLAFELAASYFRRALGLLDEQSAERLGLHQKLATALKLAGRGREAAEVYLQAAAFAPEAEAFQCRLHAADMLLKTGFVEEARALLATLLAPLGMRFAPSPTWALMAFVMRTLYILLRGYQPRVFQPDAPDVSARVRAIDLATSISDGLVYWSVADSLDFASRRLLMALSLGEVERAVRALASELAFIAVGGYRTREKVERVHRLAMELLGDRPEPMPRIALHLGYGVALMWTGQWSRAAHHYRESQRLLDAQPSELLWERAMADGLLLVVWVQQGQWHMAHRRAQELLQRARAVGDRLQELQVRLRVMSWTLLLEGELEAAQQNLTLARGLMPPGITLFNAYALGAEVSWWLAQGEGGQALAVQRQLESSLASMLHAETELLTFLLFRMRATLACLRQTGEVSQRVPLKKQLKRDLRRVERRGAPWALAYAYGIRAGLAFEEGQWAQRDADLARSLALAQAGEMEGLCWVLREVLVRGGDQRASQAAVGPAAAQEWVGIEVRRAALILLGWFPTPQ